MHVSQIIELQNIIWYIVRKNIDKSKHIEPDCILYSITDRIERISIKIQKRGKKLPIQNNWYLWESQFNNRIHILFKLHTENLPRKAIFWAVKKNSLFGRYEIIQFFSDQNKNKLVTSNSKILRKSPNIWKQWHIFKWYVSQRIHEKN